MLHPEKMNMEQDSEFKWGERLGVGRTNKDVRFYRSFTFQGVEYSLYDSVHLYKTGALETDIGKIIKIYSTATEKKVRIVWFLRPAEICNFLGDYQPHWKEIFLASGEGTGLSNLNPLEAIVGKCNVVCVSEDTRNPRPSKEEFRTANYFFHSTFDVDRRKILQKFPDQIYGIKVEKYFNRRKQQSLTRMDQAGPSNVPSNSQLDKVVAYPVKNGKPSSKSIRIGKESESRRPEARPSSVPSNSQLSKVVLCPLLNVKGNTVDPLLPPVSTPDTRSYKKMKTADSRLPDIDKSGWFKPAFWEERLRTAEGNGTLVLLDNLDPSFTSSEVQGLVWAAFKQMVEAKMIPCTPFSNPRYGKAFVIFKSSDDAETAIVELNRRCLTLADGRPVIGTICRGTLKVPDKTSRFYGHLTIDKHRLKSQREEMRKAVSTSHFAQPNTVEYDMAMDWCLLQERSDLWWKALYQDHEEEEKEIKKLGEQKVKFN
ncbi:putative BAH domain, nucleotide-binding alpha-beta plait domain-containing protein [Rosa chinensis]|uniref:Putative BAH domain, nucleotide-binding alpha-beta plait domain-containing protein n=1 Tax=Rosa chinensis TaxID=74649 RepID=A0A2P6RWH2_ROSCH|nr:protein ANTI-SILENCING 1 isoform X2 [Rosa chinensis]PRQ50774.1 putative BAH domain, nucleotide-binding alpha-beta plait domain-containing protein [Rosa chinensis]